MLESYYKSRGQNVCSVTECTSGSQTSSVFYFSHKKEKKQNTNALLSLQLFIKQENPVCAILWITQKPEGMCEQVNEAECSCTG